MKLINLRFLNNCKMESIKEKALKSAKTSFFILSINEIVLLLIGDRPYSSKLAKWRVRSYMCQPRYLM